LDELTVRRQIESARGGDADAFARLFHAFRGDVERLCRRLLGGAPEFDDAVSEVFLRAHRALESYDTARPLRNWLLSIAAHHCVDRLRRRSSEQRLFPPGDLEPDQFATPGPSPLQQRLRAETRREVLDAIDALPDRYRAPIVLRYFADFDYAAIAEALEVSRNQVSTLLFRAKRQLREQLDPAPAAEVNR
jgi:RNA polymerase sigma-70 factor (ECF subfamily)